MKILISFFFLIIIHNSAFASTNVLVYSKEVSTNSYQQFLSEKNYTSLTSYLKLNLNIFDLNNKDISTLNYLKESDQKRYIIFLNELLNKVLALPLTEKNKSFLCQANEELKQEKLNITDPKNLFIKHICYPDNILAEVDSISRSVHSDYSADEITNVFGSDYILLQNGEIKYDQINEAYSREISQWTFINNINVPFVFYGRFNDFITVLKAYLNSSDSMIARGVCNEPKINEALPTELNFQILFSGQCISQNYINLNRQPEAQQLALPELKEEKKIHWLYWGIAAIALTAFFSKHELIIEY